MEAQKITKNKIIEDGEGCQNNPRGEVYVDVGCARSNKAISSNHYGRISFIWQ